MRQRPKHTTVIAFALLTCLLSLFYMAGRTILWIYSPGTWADKTFATLLLFSEAFMSIHAIGYLSNLIITLRRNAAWWLDSRQTAQLETEPLVAVIVPSYHEPLEILSNTLTCLRNLTYSNKQIFLLDDSRYDRTDLASAALLEYRKQIEALCEECGVNLFRHRWRGAKAGVINDFLWWARGEVRDGVSVQLFQDDFVEGLPKYVAVFDAEQNPLPDFLEPLLAVAEREPTVAFIQTPHYYTNFESNRVARAAGLMQVFFYEYICEGKGAKDAMFCCGSNVMFREEALWRVKGLEEGSVTEDFATSLKFHLAGWSSLYYPKVSAFGLGPLDLKSFFTQQYRWARGTLGLLPVIAGSFITRPHKMSLAKWWEYLLSGTHYLVGFVFLITAVCPIFFLILDQPTYFTTPEFYIFFYWPYTLLAALTFVISLRDRRYRLRDIVSGLLLIPITFPVYIRAAFAVIARVKGSFGVTGKSNASSLSLRSLWPQVLLNAASFSGMVWGINRIVHHHGSFWALFGNVVWCAYFTIVTSFVFYFNNSEERHE